jgi:hypothetical protein
MTSTFFSTKPFRIEAFRVERARPFKTVLDVKQALRKYRAGESIGFTRKSSLVAMGLLPRQQPIHGYKYVVSEKYR